MPNYEVGSPADPMLGREVEGYRITDLIGKGGMGAVYAAFHLDIGQRAAVKVLSPEYSTDVEAVSRFVAEARAASKVRHGGLVKIFYSGRLADGTAYIMMEFLDGESLEERLRRLTQEKTRMELSVVTRLGQQIASALTAVHSEGIVHRDLKPANLLLVADPEIEGGERIKLVDFGIAKFDHATTELSQTTIGRFLGTALYASPEQCQMAGQVDAKADVYSLGVMLYEILAGRTPFVAEQPGMVIGMHLFLQPKPLWELAPDVPTSLHRLVHQMLAKDPEKRPSMGEVQSRLAEVKPERPSVLRHLRRNALAVAAAAGVVLLAGTAVLWQTAQHRPPARVAPQVTTARGEVPPAMPTGVSAMVPAPGPSLGLADRAAAPFAEPAPAALALPTALAAEEPTPPGSKSRKGKSARRGADKSHRQESLVPLASPPEEHPPTRSVSAATPPPLATPLAGSAPRAPAPETTPAKTEPKDHPAKPAKDDGILR